MPTDDKSYIVKSRDLSEIIKNPDAGAIEELLEEPGAVLAALLTAFFKSGPVAFFGPVIRLTQAAFKGEAYKQLGEEVRLLRKAGTLKIDPEGNRVGYQTWVELLTIIDGETPDQERLEALKAMFLAANRMNATDGEHVLAYQLFQIAKRLTSNDLLVLKATYELHLKPDDLRPNNPTMLPGQTSEGLWRAHVAKALGHELTSLVRRADIVLVEEQLLEPANNFHVRIARLTDLGLVFCRNIETYKIELNRASLGNK
jgi:hypothetical protein